MSRIDAAIQSRLAAKQKVLIPYLVAGDPDLDASLRLMHALVAAGADIIELGVPFSDPAVQRAMLWIDSNQRVSGRWWTESLNSDKYHLITYSGTCLVLLSLSKYRALARPEP